jgi:hypothetical protein
MHRRREVRGRLGKSNLSGGSKTESSITGHEGDADDDGFAHREPSTLMQGRNFGCRSIWLSRHYTASAR